MAGINNEIQDFFSAEVVSLEQANFDSKYYKLKLQEYEEYLFYRRIWSRAILSFVVVILTFNIIFIIFVGFGWWHFNDEWVARLIFLGNFAEVLGLAKILVDFLFPSQFKNIDSVLGKNQKNS